MKRLFALLLCLSLFCPPRAWAAEEKLVALTFDDGPSGQFTRRLLDGLQERNVKATFLLCGYRMAQYPQLTRQIFEQGHEIGLHGYTHKAMDQMLPEEIRKEIYDTLALVPEGCDIQFLRPPGGQCNRITHEAAKEAGFSLLCWSVDPRDWACHDTAVIAQQVLGRVRDGDVILLHDMTNSSVDAALRIIDSLQAQGFRFVTVSQLARAKNITLQPGQKYCRFP